MAQKTVVVGVTGCIAAYKACEIVRLLEKANVRVRVVMTEHATHFVGPVTFEALTHEPVMVGMFDERNNDPIPHISLAHDADAMLIAPCTANVAAKLANGVADDLLTSAALALTAPLVIAPAANVHMYEHPATQSNLEVLRNRGARIVEGGEGYLACGDEGRGRLAEPLEIVDAVLEALKVETDMAGMKVLVTAGPTIEPIDPVRFITNYSSGKTGFAIARAAAERGAGVTLVTGPVAEADPAGVSVVRVNTACEMLDACSAVFDESDIAVFSAAVSDLRPAYAADRKLKKGADDNLLERIDLVRNPDILATLAQGKKRQVVIGYAAETNDVIANARKKLLSKNADAIVANKVGPTEGFGTDDNSIWIVTEEGEEAIERAAKDRLAHVVLDRALSLIPGRA